MAEWPAAIFLQDIVPKRMPLSELIKRLRDTEQRQNGSQTYPLSFTGRHIVSDLRCSRDVLRGVGDCSKLQSPTTQSSQINDAPSMGLTHVHIALPQGKC